MKRITELNGGDIIYLYKISMNIQHKDNLFIQKIKCKVDNYTSFVRTRRLTQINNEPYNTSYRKKVSVTRRFISMDEGVYKGNIIWLCDDDIVKALNIYKKHLLDVKSTYEMKIKNLDTGVTLVDDKLSEIERLNE